MQLLRSSQVFYFHVFRRLEACVVAAMEQGPDQLKNWTASLAEKLAADETKKCTFLTKPQFKCVICNDEIVRSPVFQCRSGHLACSECPRRGCRCTKCGKAISGVRRNEAIEEIIDSLNIICKYENLGCKGILDYKSYMEHEKTCLFKPINCPIPNCKQAGVTNSWNSWLQHVMAKHKVSLIVNTITIWSYSSASFNLDSNWTTKVLLKPTTEPGFILASRDSYLLHQVATQSGDRLHLTNLTDSGLLRRYELSVKIKLADPNIEDEIQHCYKFESKTNTDGQYGLLVPKHEPASTKLCKILIYHHL